MISECNLIERARSTFRIENFRDTIMRVPSCSHGAYRNVIITIARAWLREGIISVVIILHVPNYTRKYIRRV